MVELVLYSSAGFTPLHLHSISVEVSRASIATKKNPFAGTHLFNVTGAEVQQCHHHHFGFFLHFFSFFPSIFPIFSIDLSNSA